MTETLEEICAEEKVDVRAFQEYVSRFPEYFPEDAPIRKRVQVFRAIQSRQRSDECDRRAAFQRLDSMVEQKHSTKTTPEAMAIVKEAMAAKNGTPVYVIRGEDKDGNAFHSIDNGAYADYLHEHFNVVNFKGVLYLYNTETCLYQESMNEIESHVRTTYMQYRCAGKLSSILKEVMTHIESMGNCKEYPFNTSTDSVPVRNGIVRICDGMISLLPHGPEHRFTYKLNIDYNPNVPKCKIMKLFEEWTDKESAAELIQIPAQAILQMQLNHPYKKAYLVQGAPHAAKSTYLDFLKLYVFTPEFVSGIRLQQVCEDRFASGQLEGKMLNVYDDLEDVPLETVDSFKTLTGSCSHNIERKFKGGYLGKISAVHVFSCNFAPEYPSKVMRDSAFWERWEYVVFPNHFDVDPTFYERVFTEELKSSFLNAVLAAITLIKKYGLLVKSDAQTVMQMWSVNADPVFEFIARHFNPGDGKKVTKFVKGDIYAMYLKHCAASGIPERKIKRTLTSFTQSMMPHGFFPKQSTISGRKNVEVYESTLWTLKTESDADGNGTTNNPGLF